MVLHYLFAGEKRSRTAIERGWHWDDDRLAGKTALRVCGVRKFTSLIQGYRFSYVVMAPDSPIITALPFS